VYGSPEDEAESKSFLPMVKRGAGYFVPGEKRRILLWSVQMKV
jgi:hypothetical protein